MGIAVSITAMSFMAFKLGMTIDKHGIMLKLILIILMQGHSGFAEENKFNVEPLFWIFSSLAFFFFFFFKLTLSARQRNVEKKMLTKEVCTFLL